MQSDKLGALIPAVPAPTAAAQPHKLRKKADKRRARGANAEHAALLDEYFAVLNRLRNLQDFFQRITDDDLISSCIYEMNAAQQQYAYILGRLKEENVTYLKILR